jgi:hypothetical protein
MTVAAIAGGFSVIAALISGWFTYLAARSKLVQKATAEVTAVHREMAFQTLSMGFDEADAGLHENERDIWDLIKSTEIDRVLRLKAWNGLDATKYVTAYVQFREDGQKLLKYANYPTDDDYNSRLYEIRRNGSMFFKVEQDPQSKIMSTYIAEGVKATLWTYATTVKLEGSDSHCIVFMSFASHTKDEISPATRVLCEGICERYADMVRRWHHIHPETEVVA